MTLEEANAEAKRRWGDKAAAWYWEHPTGGAVSYVVGFPLSTEECELGGLSIVPKPFLTNPNTVSTSFEAAFGRVDRALSKLSRVIELEKEFDEIEARKKKVEDEYTAASKEWRYLNRIVSIRI